ncbi:MAG: DeoR/GlpR family DNA-binding transcription regulator [Eubacteriales bacterium]|nr:DeoR/GlpR family DNA-binding transcription regulator [Eubacteriales bacterium]
MYSEERQDKIEQYILKNDSASVQELSSLFSVSEVTIRKDLEELQKGNRIIRTHGGAMIKYSNSAQFYFQDLKVKCPFEKKIIARKAMEYICDGDVILLDGSTTTNELAIAIAASSLKDLTIVTTSLSVAMLFSDKEHFPIYLIGGSLNKKMNTLCGAYAEQQIASYSVDKAFIGINGVDPYFGFSASELSEVAMKNAIFRSCSQCFIMADHTKFDKRYFLKVFDLSDKICRLITDDRPDLISYEEYESRIPLVRVKTH